MIPHHCTKVSWKTPCRYHGAIKSHRDDRILVVSRLYRGSFYSTNSATNKEETIFENDIEHCNVFQRATTVLPLTQCHDNLPSHNDIMLPDLSDVSGGFSRSRFLKGYVPHAHQNPCTRGTTLWNHLGRNCVQHDGRTDKLPLWEQCFCNE